jgi:hypothetical protein
MTRPSAIIGDILAVWEDVANDSALEFHRLAEDHAFRLLRDGAAVAEDVSKADRIEAERKEWAEVERARDQSTAWRLISNALRRYLRIMKIHTFSKRRTDADNARRAAEAKKRKRSYYA